MGLGTKIKEAIHGDKDTRHSPPPTDKTPGAFPSGDVPRTYTKHGSTHNDSTIPSAGEPRTEKLHGKNSPDYTYGAKDSTLAGTGTRTGTGTSGHGLANERQGGGLSHHGGVANTTGMTSTAGMANTTGASNTTGTHHNKLTKEANHPYWGDSERRVSDESATGIGGTHARTHNEGLSTTGHQSHGTYDDVPGVGARQELHGNPATHGTARGTTHGATGMTGATSGHSNRHGDRISTGPTAGGATTGVASSTGPGMTSNLTHRPYDNDTTRRDYKVDEYDAPTNSSGRGKHGLAGAAGGAAGGVAASELASRHHRDDMREYDTLGSSSSTDRGLNTTDRWHNTSPRAADHMGTGAGTGMGMGTTTGRSGVAGHNSGSMLDPTGPTGGVMGNDSSMLDPHNTTSRTTYGHAPGHHSNTNTGIAANEYGTGHDSRMADNYGSTRGVHHDPGLNSHASRNSMGSGSDYGGSNSSRHNNGPMGMGGSTSSGMGDGHHGPGHSSSKVLHRCDHCGNDNDISRYFSKEAVYRMT